MNTYQAIVTKRDTRAYLARPIPDDVLRRVLNAGRMAGSSKNSQPCRLVVLRERERIAALAKHGEFTKPLLDAAAIVAILLERDAGGFDAGRVGQNMMVAAWAEGIASCPVYIQDRDGGTRALRAPDQYRIAMCVALGYPDPGTPLSRGQKRLPLEDLVHWEGW